MLTNDIILLKPILKKGRVSVVFQQLFLLAIVEPHCNRKFPPGGSKLSSHKAKEDVIFRMLKIPYDIGLMF